MMKPPVRGSAKRYVATMLAVAFAGLAATAALSVVIDPYWLFDSPRVSGVNYWKTELGAATRTVKPQHVAWNRPENIILGASTAEAGLDPVDAGWEDSGYNMAYGGGHLSEAVQSLSFAIENGAHRIVLVLDFVRFHADLEKAPLKLPKASSSTISWFGNSNLFLPAMQVTLGVDALRDAVLTVMKQRQFDSSDRRLVDRMIDRNGFRRPEFAQALVDEVGGTTTAFQRAVVVRVTRSWFPDPCRRWRFTDDAGLEPQFALIEDALRIARENEIDLYLVLPPMHAVMPLAMQAVDVYGAYEDWKRRLANLVAREGARLGNAPFPLYDFGVISDVTAEPVPPGDGRMKYYTDPAHFRPELGRLIFDRLFGSKHSIVPPEFGRRLTPDNVDQYLEEDRVRLESLPERDNLLVQIVNPALVEHEAWIKSRPTSIACR